MGTLWFNGTFFTMEEEGETISAVYIKDGFIEGTGNKEQLEERYGRLITKKINLQGAFVYPGFVDSHLHIIGHGEKLIRLDLSDVEQAEEMKQLLEAKYKETTKNQWLFGDGWNENNFPDRKIFHRSELDEIAPDTPMFLTRVCRHAALVNTKALKLAGITKDTEDPVGGVIVRDNQGEPTGFLLDTAADLVKEVIPDVTNEYVAQALGLAIHDLFRVGLVGGHTEDLHYYNGFKQTFDQFKNIIDGEEIKFRAHLLVHHEATPEMEREGYKTGEVTPFLELGAMKIFADGALGGRTAYLQSPYTDDPSISGVAIHSQESLENLLKQAREKESPVAIHTIGDAALNMALTALEKHPLLKGRDRLIHVQVVDDTLIERMKKLPVILDLQPRFVASDFPWVMERLGEERIKQSFAWKTLLHHGLHCAGGSDAPIEPVDPLLGIHAAITRKRIGEDHNGYLPEQKLTPYEAVQLFTSGSAFAIEKEHERGKITKGYVADFTVLDQNIFTIDPDDILETNVLMTVVDNTIMYQK
ncbi:exoenzymes regulatory protein AepA in lipid-linked oligosaccharide synthesis cluster [Halalkalibacter wakoensis JCM 9140]|uniref:Exoenzymes regulatory protein AepA in lipid-linked oligosaccharide synthesis cluster n=1 Tax=Halalkalibacter wakoensis JCM 9140 TaxID=1236970 RepID=W4Q178_9BACI|nr:amidohydrolase [Halalkalibacter wakoensis]GAE25836.1 exoenzymes regulatory protein AepA in lipid-linked oligosaccharide synthesis cluster [Halalkalibacter wakoensis JCM 9140]